MDKLLIIFGTIAISLILAKVTIDLVMPDLRDDAEAQLGMIFVFWAIISGIVAAPRAWRSFRSGTRT